jgi:gliding motility-associated-like protein
MGAQTYQWQPATWLNNPYADTVMAHPTQSGNWTYTVIGYDQNGCSASATVNLNATPAPNDDTTPNLITPNGDGRNDTWVVPMLYGMQNYTLKIFARGGTEVYSTSSYHDNWDATLNGSNLPDGTYWYIIHTSQKDYKGAITVKR